MTPSKAAISSMSSLSIAIKWADVVDLRYASRASASKLFVWGYTYVAPHDQKKLGISSNIQEKERGCA